MSQKQWVVTLNDDGTVTIKDHRGWFPPPGDWDRIKFYGDDVERQNAKILGVYDFENEVQD